MARFLFTWELGGGHGHVGSLTAIAAALQHRGHEVIAALEEPARGDSLVRAGAHVRPLPSRGNFRLPGEREIATYAELLAANGFDDCDQLREGLSGWDRLFEEVRPDAVLFDHSPLAMLAAAGHGLPGLQHGTGFYIPPHNPMLPVLRPWLLTDRSEAIAHERRILAGVNRVLRERGRGALDQLGQIYALQESWLATYQELDHFAEQRPPATGSADQTIAPTSYRGIVPPSISGLRPEWPANKGPKIFAYLHADDTSLAIVHSLVEIGYPAIVRITGLSAEQSGLLSPNVRLIAQAARLDELAAECDLAILNGGHGTLAAILLAGKPAIISPIQLEQLLLARRCVASGLGTVLAPSDVANLQMQLEQCLSPGVRGQAAAFARRYPSQDRPRLLDQLIERLEELAGRRV